MDMHSQSVFSEQLLLENLPSAVIQINREGKVLFLNKSARTFFGLSEKQTAGTLTIDTIESTFIDKDFIPFSLSHHILSIIEAEKISNPVVLGKRVSGQERWFSVDSSPVIKEGKWAGLVIQLTNISSAVVDNLKQKEQIDRYKILVENINGVVWESRLGSKTFTYVSPQAQKLLGFSMDQWIKEGFWQSRIHDNDKEHVLEYERTKVLESTDYQLEYRLLDSNNKEIWIRDLVEVVYENGKASKLRGLMLDVSDIRLSGELIRKSEQRYRRMISEAPYSISIYNANGLLIAANAKTEQVWGVELSKYVQSYNILESNDFDIEETRHLVKEAFEGKAGELTSKFYLSNDRTQWIRVKYYPLFDEFERLENVVYVAENISDFKRAEVKIIEQESLKQNIMDALDEAILVVDANGIIINLNKNLRRYLKKDSRIDLEIGKSIFEFVEILDDSEYIKQKLKDILNQDLKQINQELRLKDDKWYNLRAASIDHEEGAVISFQNINTRKEIEMALEKSLQKYRDIYNKAPVMMHSINADEEFVSVSDYWLEKMGYTRSEVIGRRAIDFMQEESYQNVSDYFTKLLKAKKLKNLELRFKKKSGEVMDVLLSAVAEFDENGLLERSITGMADITELKQVQRQVEQSEAKLLESQRISKIANYEFDVRTGEFNPSKEMSAMMGLTMSNRHISIIEHFIHPNDLMEFITKLRKAIDDGNDFFHIYRIYHLANKELKWISGRGKVKKNSKGEVVKMIGTMQDITEQKQAEQKIKRLSNRILLATEIANLGVWEYDSDSNEVFWEDQMFSIFSDKLQPFGLKTWVSYLDQSDKSAFKKAIKKIHEGVNFLEFEFKLCIDNNDKFIRAFTRITRNLEGSIKGMVGVLYDITADKRLQLKLESSLEEKNVLVKEVHHRVKNNLQLISSILALKSFDLVDSQSKDIFTEVNHRIRAMSVIHDKLYKFYNVSEVNLNEYLQNIGSELQILQDNYAVKLVVQSEDIVMDVEKALLIGLIVSEMVSNALKHGFESDVTGVVEIHFSKMKSQYQLRVINDGKKLASDVLQTSKGLGVSLIKTFVNQLEGTVAVDPQNGFIVCF